MCGSTTWRSCRERLLTVFLSAWPRWSHLPAMLAVRRLRRWLQRLFSVASPAALAGLVAACASPMSPGAKLDDAVQETNLAMRMGRHDIAIEHVAAAAR